MFPDVLVVLDHIWCILIYGIHCVKEKTGSCKLWLLVLWNSCWAIGDCRQLMLWFSVIHSGRCRNSSCWVGSDQFLSHPFLFIIHQFYLILYFVVWTPDRTVKSYINRGWWTFVFMLWKWPWMGCVKSTTLIFSMRSFYSLCKCVSPVFVWSKLPHTFQLPTLMLALVNRLCRCCEGQPS